MGDEQGRAVGHDRAQGVVDAPLRRGVDGAGGVVEDQDARVGEDGPGQGDPLALAAREGEAPLADDRVVAPRQLLDELVRPAPPGPPPRSPRRWRPGGRRRCWPAPSRRTGSSPRRPRRPGGAATRSVDVAHVVAVDPDRARGRGRRSAAPAWPPSTCRCRSGRRWPPARRARCAGRTPASTGGAVAVGEVRRRRRRSRPRSGGSSTASGASAMAGCRSSSWKMRSTPARACWPMVRTPASCGPAPPAGRRRSRRPGTCPRVISWCSASQPPRARIGHLAEGRDRPRAAAGSATGGARPASGSRRASRRRRPRRSSSRCSWPKALTTRTPLTSSSTIWATSPSRCWPSQVAGKTRQRIR